MKHTFTLKRAIPCLALILLGIAGNLKAETVIPIGDGSTYKTIQTAYDAIKNAAVTTAITDSYVLELQSDYVPTSGTTLETFPITLNAINGASATNTITIRPKSGVKMTLSYPNQTVVATNVSCAKNATSINLTTVSNDVSVLSTSSYVGGQGVPNNPFQQLAGVDAPNKNLTLLSTTITTQRTNATLFFGPQQTKTINFDGAKYVTIDGVSRTDASTGLTISNPNCIYSQTIYFTGGAQYNTIKNCKIRGANQTSTSSAGGVGATIFFNTTSYNTITLNDVCDMEDGITPMPIAAFQVTGVGTNTYNTISENNIYNIENLWASASTNSGFVNLGSPYNANSHHNDVLNNKMYWTRTANFYTGTTVVGLGVGGSMSGLGNRFEGNVIGYANANGTGISQISGAGATFKAVNNLRNFTCINNTVANIEMTGANLTGIDFGGSNTSTPSADDVCRGNTVQNIKLTLSANGTLTGIKVNVSNPYNSNIKNNIVRNLNVESANTGVICTLVGIDVTGTHAAKVYNYSSNQLYNLTAGNSASTVANKVYGLKTTINANTVIEKNLIYDLFAINDNTTITEIHGINTNNIGFNKWTTGTSYSKDVFVYNGNNVYKSTAPASGTATSTIAPVHTSGNATEGTLIWAFQYTITPSITFKNNVIRIGESATNSNTLTYGIYQNAQFSTNDINKFYHNSIFIGGTALASATQNTFVFYQAGSLTPATNDLKNNIFANQRTNASGTAAKHYAIGFETAGVLKTSDNNLYWSSPVGLAVGDEKADLAAWKDAVASGSDAASLSSDPKFMDATATLPDLRIKANYQVVDQVGADLSASVTDDYDGNVRSSFTPYDLGAFAYNYAATATSPSDYFRTLASGNWRTNGTWQSSANNSAWITATAFPSAAATSVTILNGHTVTAAADATVSTLTVNGGGKLTLNNNATLSATNLALQSHVDNGTATFVDNNVAGGLTVSGTKSVEQYITAGRSWYVSSPVATATSNVFGAATSSTNKLHYYNETTGTATPWTQITDNSTSLQVGRGYVSSMPTDGVVTFTGGALNTGTITTGANGVASITRTAGQTKEGFNLIGNPYPSYLNVMTAINANTNLEKSVWYRTKDASTYYFETVNTTSGVGTNLANKGTVTGYIPPMQAFWVRATATTTLALTNAMRSHATDVVVGGGTVPTTLLRSANVDANSSSLIRLQVSNGLNKDEVIFYSKENASNDFDAYDSQKMSNGNAAIPEIYTSIGAEQLVINGMKSFPLNQELPLGFKTGAANAFSIKVTEFSNMDSDIKLVLKDKVSHTEQELNLNVPYNFNSEVVDDANRFSLVFKSASGSTALHSADLASAVEVYKNANNQIVISTPEVAGRKVAVSVYNTVGQKLQTTVLTNSTTVLPQRFTAGMYLVAVSVNGSVEISKVLIN